MHFHERKLKNCISEDTLLSFVPKCTFGQHCFRWWLCARKVTNHYLNQCWPAFPTPHGITRPQSVKSVIQGSIKYSIITTKYNGPWLKQQALQGPRLSQDGDPLGTIWCVCHSKCNCTHWPDNQYALSSPMSCLFDVMHVVLNLFQEI